MLTYLDGFASTCEAFSADVHYLEKAEMNSSATVFHSGVIYFH